MDGDTRPHRALPWQAGPEPWNCREPLRLAERWALAADDLQWIILHARNHRGATKWQAVAFVASTTAVLRRVLREKGIALSPEGQCALNALEPTYREWREAANG